MNKPLNILADGRLFHSWDDLDRYLSVRRLKYKSTVKIEENNYEVSIDNL
jgi:hypothetical protein